MKTSIKALISIIIFLVSAEAFSQIPYAAAPNYLMTEPIDISGDFRDFSNTYYLADSLAGFNPASASGKIKFKRHEYATRMAFNNILGALNPVNPNEFPSGEYDVSPALPFSIEFISERAFRIKVSSGLQAAPASESLMLVNGAAPVGDPWQYSKTEKGHSYSGKYGSVTITEYPWRIEIYNAEGKLLTRSMAKLDNDTTYTPVLPFSFVRRASDYSRSFAAVFNNSPNEKFYGCGESFTSLNKRGQKVVLFTDDANGVENETMYKPIPFYMSSRGYGIFMHTSTPITIDFGKYYSGASSLMIGDDALDLFVFLGEPKEILDAYTDLTGKPSMPPLWSFGFWQSRITYFSEKEGRAVADKLRKYEIPCDVLHFDTGWFETDWRCDYQFSKSRFTDATKMIGDLKKMGIHTCLWQLPYFVPKNTLFDEIVEKGLAVRDRSGNIPYEDAVLDFSNPETVDWYQQKIAGLLEQGVSAIKVDFGEAAPVTGLYHSGRTGFYEHNLYPLRYNKTVAEITQKVNGESIIWARSAWAGSQRYPLHWGGDAAASNIGMAAQLRGGLSFGASGFSFWSHDIGGFTMPTPEGLFRRWTGFGVLSSHTRSHGMPPKEAWEYGEDFLAYFKHAMGMRYRLMPYIYAQAKECTEKGLPMLRALFIEFPGDAGAWHIDDEYMFGSDMLVAPMFESAAGRDVYLPEGKWIDYQTGKVYPAGWHYIEHGDIEVIMLVREGSVIPHIELAQSTADMDWTKLELVVFAENSEKATALICLPEGELHKLELTKSDKGFTLVHDPLMGEVSWKMSNYTDSQ